MKKQNKHGQIQESAPPSKGKAPKTNTPAGACGALDWFRLAAALLVVAIHTSPLASFSDEADFFFTRVLSRIAVPFFFMVTGQFILSGLFENKNTHPAAQAPRPSGLRDKGLPRPDSGPIPAQQRKYLLRLCLLYGAAVLLYLPLGIYAGHYDSLNLGTALRMLLFDGTFYHLWYFPACILGVVLVCLFSRVLSLKGAALLSSLLYCLGLLGDSYFGLTEKIPVLNTMYDGMFHLFSYTRNGLFLAPLFLLLGIWAGRDKTEHPSAQPLHKKAAPIFMRAGTVGVYAALFILSFCAMTAEAFALRHFDMQRHDSMYLCLVPAMFFLYRLLLSLPAIPRKMLRTASTWIYILHPAFIVAVRGAAKTLHLTDLLVDNSLIHYLAVSCASVTTGFIMTYLSGRFFRKHKTHIYTPLPDSADSAFIEEQNTSAVSGADTAPQPGTERAWIELDLDALEHNVRFLQSCLPDGCRLMPAVKADAYGHGADIIAKSLNNLGIQDFCVACISEGIQLRKSGVTGQILILGYTHPSQFPLLRRYRLTQTIVDTGYARKLQQSGVKCHVHIAVDTGMHRLGIRCEALEELASIYKMKNLCVDGIFTHLSACDSPDPECRDFTESQLQAFYGVIDALRTEGCPCRGLHILSSYGILNYPEGAGDYARPGIALYGVPSTENEALASLLRPVLSLKARVASVRTLQPGESAGYGLDYTASRQTKLAVLAVGYADGLPRELSSGKGSVLISGKRAPVIGRICMDQTLVDVTGIPDVSSADTAVLIGVSGSQKIAAQDLAAQCNTITNEILSRLGARLNRIPVSAR